VTQKRWRTRTFGISDHLGNLNREPDGLGSHYTGLAGGATGLAGPTEGPGQGGHIVEAENVQWLGDLYDDVDKTRLSGYTVAPRHVPMSSIVEGETGLNPPQDTIGLVWRTSGSASEHWQTVLPDREPLHTAIKFGSVNMLDEAAARTAQNLPAGQEFRVELQLMGAAQSGVNSEQPWLRLRWGGKYCVFLRTGQMPGLNEMRGQTSHGSYASAQMTPLRTMPYMQPFWDYAPIAFDVRYIGGRLVLDGGGGTTIYTNRARNTDPRRYSEADSEGSVAAVAARQGPLQIEGQGVAFTLRVQEVCYADTEYEIGPVDQPDYARSVSGSGYFRRKFYTSQRPQVTAGYAAGYYPHAMSATGVEASPSAIATVEVEENTQAGAQHYRCTLDANVPDDEMVSAAWRDDVRVYSRNAMRGHSSPFVHAVTVRGEPSWRAVTTVDPVDIRPAVLSASETCADPALQAGPTWDLDIDRNILKDVAHPAGGSLGEDWINYVGRYHQIAINVGWMYDDGVLRAYPGPAEAPIVGDGMCRLFGYQMSKAPDAPGYGQRLMKIEARDPIVRLQKPAGIVDQRYAALDFLMGDKLANSNPDRKSAMYGADGVQYIIETALGETFSSNLQVFYPGYVGLWPTDTTPDQWSLMDYRMYTDPPSGSGLIWPPPFDSAALDWIRQLCDIDFSIFFYGPSWLNAKNVAPCYGNYFVYVNGTPTTRIADADYIAGDTNLAAEAASWRQAPEHDFNRMVVWGQAPGGGDLGGIMPALPSFSSEYVIENSPLLEQNASRTWERTKVAKGTHFYLPGVARRVAMLTMWMLWGLETRRVTVKSRGLEWLWWGHKVQVTADGAESDPQMDFRQPDDSLQTFRVMRVRNQYDLQRNNWTSTMNLADQPVMNPYA